MEHDGIAPGDELHGELDPEQDQRRGKRDDEREEDDVARRRAAHCEELGVLAEDVEQRLRECEARDREQLGTANRRLAEAMSGLSAGLRDRGCVFHSTALPTG